MLVDGGREGSARTWCAAAVIADTSIGRHELSRGAFGPVRTGLRIPATECVCGAAGADLVGTAGAVCCYQLPRNTRRPLRTGLRILSGGKSTGGTTLAGSVDNACSVRCDKLPRNTGRPVGASLRIHSGGISTGGTTLAGSVDNACSVRYDKLPQSTGRPVGAGLESIRWQSTFAHTRAVCPCAAGRICTRHPVIGVVRPVGTGAGEGRHGAWGGGTCFARERPVRGGPT